MADQNDKTDRLRNLLLKLTPEQQAEFYRFGVALQHFTYEIRCKFAKQTIAGASGWEDSDKKLPDIIHEKSRDLLLGEDHQDIDIASWAFIHWYRRTTAKQRADRVVTEKAHYAVYNSPKDYPGKYIVRIWRILPDREEPVPDFEPLIVADKYIDAISVVPMDKVLIMPSEGDDESLVGTWV